MNRQEQELKEFRNAWRQEVRQKNQQQQTRENKPSIAEKRPSVAESSLAEIIDKAESLTLTDKEPVTAMDHYVLAVDNERQGKLGQGTTLLFNSCLYHFEVLTYFPQHWIATVVLLN